MNSGSQVDEDSDTALTCWICWGGGCLRKGTMAYASTLVWWKAAPPALALIPDNLIPPNMSQVSFKYWSSEGVSPSKSLHRPLKRKCLGLQKPSVPLSHIPHWFLQPTVMGTSLPCTGTMAGGLVEDWDSLFLRKDLHSQGILQIFTCHRWVWGQPIPNLCASY